MDSDCDDSLGSRGKESSPVHAWLARASSIPEEYVPIESISPGYSPRVKAGTSPDHVRLLAESESPLPAIIVNRATMRVIDGAHRLAAAIAQRQTTIAVKYFDGSDDDAFALAVHANVAHGLPLSLAERKTAACRLIGSHPQWSDRLIARVTGLSHKTVGAQRRRTGGESTLLNTRLGRDGKVHRLTVAEERGVAAEFIKNNPSASLRAIAKEAAISIGTAKDVRDRSLRRGEKDSGSGHLGARSATGAVTGTQGSGAKRRVSSHEPIRGEAPPMTSMQELILSTLRNDPALRFSDRGKTLLRRLTLSIMDIQSWEQLAADVPEHALDSRAKLARANAKSWQELAGKLDNGLDRESATDRIG